MRQPRRRTNFLARALVGGLMLAWAAPAHAKDLTKLSLDEIMHLDEVQVTIPGAHFHYQGDWMVGVELSQTNYNGLQDGTTGISQNQALNAGFLTAENNMIENMEMVMVMYGVKDNYTVQVMIPQMQMSMNMVQSPVGSNGITNFAMTVAGLGDITVGVIHPFKYHYPTEFQAELNVGLPTGNIEQFAFVPPFGSFKNPYNMQLGSGSYTLQPAFTYLGQTNRLAWGGQVRGYLPLQSNHDGWESPNGLMATAWVSPYVNKHFTPSFRLDWNTQGRIRGADPNIQANSQPSAVPANYAGTRADALLGLNFALDQDGRGHGVWVSLEAGLPFYQNLTGPQIVQTGVYKAAVEWTFK